METEKKKERRKEFNRDSNMELFRIISMLLVLVFHANYLSLGRPTQEMTIYLPEVCFLRTIVNSISIVCVNCFILISGWYGIRPKIKRFVGLLFQVFFISTITIFGYSLLTSHRINGSDIKSMFQLTNNLWFVKSYIVLYLLSPALNAITRELTKRQFLLVLIALFLFQTIYGWGIVVVPYINDGYSPISFILLYLLAQYIRKYPSFLAKQTAKSYILLYFILVLINSFVDFISIRYSVLQQIQWSSYASPIIVAESAALMLFFSKLSFKSKIINWIATSCFAVYLLHCTRNILEEYCGLIKSAYDSHNFIRIIFIIISVFVISIIVDKVRIVLWNNILRWLDRKKIYINSQNAK